MEYLSDKIYHTIISNIKNVLQSIAKQIEELPHNEKSHRTQILLRHLTYLVEHVLSRLKVTPAEEKVKKDYYWELWHENRDMKKKLIELTASMEEQRNYYQSKIDKIHGHYLKNCQVVERIEDKFSEDAEALRLRFERMQINEYKQFEGRKHDLMEICALSKNKFQNFLSNIKKLEEQNFTNRLRMSGKFLALLQRYDTEIGDRVKTIANLKIELEGLRDHNRQLEERMEEQSFLHDSCFNEQENEKLSELKTKLDAIASRIAAKKIQRWWRSIFASLKTSKKKSKKKGKKKLKKK